MTDADSLIVHLPHLLSIRLFQNNKPNPIYKYHRWTGICFTCNKYTTDLRSHVKYCKKLNRIYYLFRLITISCIVCYLFKFKNYLFFKAVHARAHIKQL
jgi:hypothetical protein